MDLNQYKIDFEQVDFSYHALKRMKSRGITFEQAKKAIEKPVSIVPSLTCKNTFYYRRFELNVLIAFNETWPVVTSVWNFSPERVKSENRKRKNKVRRRHNVANKLARLAKHGRKTDFKRSRDNIVK